MIAVAVVALALTVERVGSRLRRIARAHRHTATQHRDAERRLRRGAADIRKGDAEARENIRRLRRGQPPRSMDDSRRANFARWEAARASFFTSDFFLIGDATTDFYQSYDYFLKTQLEMEEAGTKGALEFAARKEQE